MDETLVHVGRINQQIINNYNYNINEQIVINLRPGLFSFLNSIKPYYEIISFSTASKNYADNIVKKLKLIKNILIIIYIETIPHYMGRNM